MLWNFGCFGHHSMEESLFLFFFYFVILLIPLQWNCLRGCWWGQLQRLFETQKSREMVAWRYVTAIRRLLEKKNIHTAVYGNHTNDRWTTLPSEIVSQIRSNPAVACIGVVLSVCEGRRANYGQTILFFFFAQTIIPTTRAYPAFSHFFKTNWFVR